MASSDVMRPSNLIQQAPYIHHPSILYGNPPGIASGSFVSPVPVVPAVVAPHRVCLVRGEGVSVPGRASYPGMSKHVRSVGVLMKNIMQSV